MFIMFAKIKFTERVWYFYRLELFSVAVAALHRTSLCPFLNEPRVTPNTFIMMRIHYRYFLFRYKLERKVKNKISLNILRMTDSATLFFVFVCMKSVIEYNLRPLERPEDFF